MPVYFDGKDGWISHRLNRSLYPAVVTYLGNLPKDVVIYNHFGHYASQRSRSKLVSYHVQSRRRRKIVSLREGTLYSPSKSTTTQSREHGAIELYFQKSTRNKGKDRNRKQNSSPCHLTRSPDRDGCKEGGGEGRSGGKIST